jgi:hypothetical protein
VVVVVGGPLLGFLCFGWLDWLSGRMQKERSARVVAAPTSQALVYVCRFCLAALFNYLFDYLRFFFWLAFSSTTACAAPRREMGTR